MTMACHSADANRAAIAVVSVVGVIASAMPVTVVVKPGAHADTKRADLHARAAGIRTEKHLRTSWRRNADYGDSGQAE